MAQEGEQRLKPEDVEVRSKASKAFRKEESSPLRPDFGQMAFSTGRSAASDPAPLAGHDWDEGESGEQPLRHDRGPEGQARGP